VFLDDLHGSVSTGFARRTTVTVDRIASVRLPRTNDHFGSHAAATGWHWTSPTNYKPPVGIHDTHFNPDGHVYNFTIEAWALEPGEASRVLKLSTDPTRASDIAKATDLLMHYIRSEKIPDVVRRPAKILGGRALIDLLSNGDTEALLYACQEMFRFEDVSY